ncbi:MAG TPA: BON domain-containing protein [Burkholderiales bacterium]|jgi:osmotically-inducible protein OsmY|nr:BON domain-containing protein [Burkholderiales bacterium]
MRYVLTLAVFAVLPFVHGCALVAVGGAAAAGGYLVGEDRRPVNIIAEDKTVEVRISNRASDKYPTAHVNATAYNKLVLLTGEAPTEAAKTDIDEIARGVPNVRSTVNELQVGDSTSFSARANDSYITSKVKARFLDARRFNPVHVKVVTEAGTVYLLGIVTRKEADDATEIARTTSGVQKVVRVFEYQN